MKRFITYILIFFCFIAVIDISIGYLARYLNSHAKGGDTKNHYYIAGEMTDSVLIFGSSRAIHHFNPKILEDSLGMTVYNCGLDGNGIIYNYGRLMSILRRYKPRVIIYDIMPEFDMSHDDYTKYLQWQKRLYDDVPEVREVFNDVDWTERYKMISNLYKYNTSIIQMLSDNVKPKQAVSYHGYKPIDEVINYDVSPKDELPAEWDELKLKYFHRFIEECQRNGIAVIISFSPWYKAVNSARFDNFVSLCNEYRLPVIDMYADSVLSSNPNYFADASHLNSTGADLFSQKFAHILKGILHGANIP
ncbi:MAG: hypothetical protein J1E63_10920 [Muribaculaceae bacterium]|nr:hypothetical protein [Muribaculaceae bacterium]